MPILRCALMGVVLSLLPPASVAQRQLVQVTLPTRQDLVRQLVAPPGEYVELCARLRAGRALTWQFDAEAPMTFNTHFHVDGGVGYPEGMSAMSSAAGRLTPAGDHDYCWLWSNPSTVPVTIRVRLVP